MTKLLGWHKELIRHCYAAGNSPLEISEELGLPFRMVCNFIDSACLRKPLYFIAVGVRKATRADTVWLPPCQ